MWLAKSFLLFYFSSQCTMVSFFPLLLSAPFSHISLPAKLSPWPHLSPSNSLSPSFPLTSLRDGHLIHLTSWKDKYSLVECEAPASPLTQTGDEGKVSLSAELRCPDALIKSSSQPDTDMKMAARTLAAHMGFLLLFTKSSSAESICEMCIVHAVT